MPIRWTFLPTPPCYLPINISCAHNYPVALGHLFERDLQIPTGQFPISPVDIVKRIFLSLMFSRFHITPQVSRTISRECPDIRKLHVKFDRRGVGQGHWHHEVDDKVWEDIGRLKSLIILILSGQRISKLPPALVQNLINLRYLDVSGTQNVIAVPERFGDWLWSIRNINLGFTQFNSIPKSLVYRLLMNRTQPGDGITISRYSSKAWLFRELCPERFPRLSLRLRPRPPVGAWPHARPWWYLTVVWLKHY